ncbi:CE295 protein, partial [Cephalopterus ornatus]|nr:CE295 protein [Cephalopterus ornatus]
LQGIPCDLTSTISTGSFSTSEMLDASPVGTGLSSDGTEGGILRETASRPWNSSLSLTLQQRQENLPRASETRLSEGEMHLYKESQTQQILGNHTGNLNFYSEDNTCFHALAAEPCFPERERPFPNFHHHLFQSLEPSVDFDTSLCSQYGISQDSREFSKTSKFSTKSPDMLTFLEVGNSGLNVQGSSLPSCLETNRQNNIPSEESITENLT